MKGKKLRIFGGGLILGALVFTALWMCVPPEMPVYNGRALSFWLQGFGPMAGQVMDTVAYPTFAEAKAALDRTGAKSLPTLLRMLRTRDDGLFFKIEDWYEQHRLLRQRPDYIDPTNQRMGAALGLRMTGSNAESVVPQLISIYKRQKRPADLGIYIPTIFTAIGPGAIDAVPSLSHALTNELSPDARQCAAEALGSIHSQPSIAVPALLLALRDPSKDVQAQAALSLGEFGTYAESALPTLLVMAQRPGPRRRGSFQRWDRGTISTYTPAAAAEDAIEMITKNSQHWVDPTR